MAQQGASRQACGADIKQLCPEIKPGEGRLKACFKEHFGQLSAPCQTALLSNVTITKACKADPLEKCPDIQPGGGRIQACMKDHFTELKEPCKDSLLLARAPATIGSRGANIGGAIRGRAWGRTTLRGFNYGQLHKIRLRIGAPFVPDQRLAKQRQEQGRGLGIRSIDGKPSGGEEEPIHAKSAP
jgi:hypothetical protein